MTSSGVIEDDTPTLLGQEDSQERLFDQYFRNNNNNVKNNPFLKRSMSLEDIRNEKETLTNPNQSTSVFAPIGIFFCD